MDNVSKFCERLRELMDENQITPENLAKAIDYNEVYHWLSGKYMPSFNNLISLADYFKCSINYLVGLDDEYLPTSFKKCPPFSVSLPFILKECGSNIYRLSKASKIDRRTIYDWIEGQYLPSLENLIKIAASLNCPIDYIVGRED